MVDFQKIKELRSEIDKLLKERPEYKPFQEMIEKELKKAGNNHHNRMTVLHNMLIESRTKMIDSIHELKKEIDKAKNIINKESEIKKNEK